MKIRILSHALVAIALVAAMPMLDVASSAPQEEEIRLVTTPSKMCHPKKPLTCRAADIAALSTAPQAESQQAALCIGPRWLCSASTGRVSTHNRQVTAPVPVEQMAALCIGPRWLCSSSGS